MRFNPRVPSCLKHPLRFLGRSVWLGAELVLAAVTYVIFCGFRRQESRLTARTRWLQMSSARILRIFRMTTQVSGTAPTRGLLISNHLGYLDILVYAALFPATFVAKREVKGWPVFGWFASLAGTVFVNRERRTQAGKTAGEMEAILQAGGLVVLFPEGTSSDGQTVLPFKTAVLEPATRREYPLTVSFIRYELDDGDVGEEICYWKDMTFFPHLLNLMTKRSIRVFVTFAAQNATVSDRKQLAQQLHGEVLGLKDSNVAPHR